MNLNPFAWLRNEVNLTLLVVEKLDRNLDTAHQSLADLKTKLEMPLTVRVNLEFPEKSPASPTSPPSYEPAPATPPKYVPIPVHGYTYFENTKDGFGWITKMANETQYKCFYCDGHRKELVYRGSQKHAREWMAQFYS